MTEILNLITGRWPEVTFVVLVAAIVVMAFRYINENLLKEYRALLGQYRDRNESMLKELGDVQARNTQLASACDHLRGSVQVLEAKIRELSADLERWEATWREMQASLTHRLNELGIETKALFDDRDQINRDLDLAWTVLFKLAPGEQSNQRAIDEVVERRQGNRVRPAP